MIFGAHDGKCVTVSAGVHCREYVGIQAVIELARTIDPKDIYGELHLVHAFNYDGLICRCSGRFSVRRENLNRVFPGSTCGTDAEKLAAFLEETVIRHSDCIVDLHSGGGYEYLTPHVYLHGAAAPEVCAQSQELAMHGRSVRRALAGEKRVLQSRRYLRRSGRSDRARLLRPVVRR